MDQLKNDCLSLGLFRIDVVARGLFTLQALSHLMSLRILSGKSAF